MKILFTCIFYLLLSTLFAQQKPLSFEHLTLENGLPENYPRCIIQDKIGYIWIGTQNGLVRFDGYSSKVYKLVTGKPGGSGKEQITCLFADKQGAIWVGMRYDGLFRYNRSEDNFSQVKAGSSTDNLTTHGEVRFINDDKNGKLWIVNYDYKTDKCRLALYDPIDTVFVDYCKTSKAAGQLPADQIYCLLKDNAGRIWFGTNDGLYEFDENSKAFRSYLTGNDPSTQKSITGIYEAPSEPDILWIRGKYTSSDIGFGLIRFDAVKKTTTKYVHDIGYPASLIHDSVSAIMEDHQKHLWIGTSIGISLLDRGSGKFAYYIPRDGNAGNNENIFASMQDDRSGDIWSAGGKGLIRFDPQTKQFTRYTAEEERPDGLPTNNIEKIFIDASGIIWLTTKKTGLHRINKQRSIFTLYRNIPGNPQSYPGGNTIDFVQGSDKNNFWLATDKGLVHWYPGQNKFEKIDLNKNNKETGNIITHLVFDKEGKIWCSDLQKGLYCYDPVTTVVKNYHSIKGDTSSLSNNYVRTIMEDKTGTLWIGTYGGGLCSLNKATGKMTRYPYVRSGNETTGKELDDSMVASIYEDRNGILWIGTMQGGINKFDRHTNTFTSYHDTKKGFEYITKILEDRSGQFWISSFLYGLHLFDRASGTSRRFTEKEGLLCDVIQSLEKDDSSGDIWITSIRGLSRLNTKTFSFSNYTRAQGLPESNLSRGLLFTNNKELYAGCIGGFLSFSPSDITPNRVGPFINIESVSYINLSKGKEKNFIINGEKNITLGFNEKQITFHFTALHFINPSLNQYAYKLEGYDQDWVQGGIQRTATYTNLSPGTYTFYVKAANSDGIWTEIPNSFTVTINKPWWQTWWAFLLFALTAVAISWGVYKIYRASQLNKVNHRLEEMVLQRTKELKASLEELKETQQHLVQREKMASLGELTAGIAHEIQNPLNFVKNFSEVSAELLDEMNFELEKGNDADVKLISNDIKQNLEKIILHGTRADAIVKGMLQHSQTNSGKKEPTDINALADEYMRLAYHGLRAKDKSFNAITKTDLDKSIGKINIIPQDIGRVILNLLTNAFYSVNQRNKEQDGYEGIVSLSTQRVSGVAKIRITDNGNGIPEKIIDKIYQPFFTTKPTGEGTGLGLSLSYDIIKAHGGQLKVESKEGEGAEFLITLPV